MSEDKKTKTAKLYHKMNWDKTNEELLRDYSAIDTSSIDDPKLKIEDKTNSLTILIQNIYKSIPEKNLKENNAGLSSHIRTLIKEIRKAINRWKKTKDPQIKQHFNFLKTKNSRHFINL